MSQKQILDPIVDEVDRRGGKYYFAVNAHKKDSTVRTRRDDTSQTMNKKFEKNKQENSVSVTCLTHVVWRNGGVSTSHMYHEFDSSNGYCPVGSKDSDVCEGEQTDCVQNETAKHVLLDSGFGSRRAMS